MRSTAGPLKEVSTTNHGLVEFCQELQQHYESETTADLRKGKGQVFTPPSVCRFMAGLFVTFPKEFRLLDPGAGVGSLSAAVCERIMRLHSPRRVEVHLFENDARLAELLDTAMRRCKKAVCEAGHSMSYEIHGEDYVLASSGLFDPQKSLFADRPALPEFDGVIMNPPYFKVNKGGVHARVMGDVIHGQPNIYAFFMAICGRRLRQGGQMVAITPRSFCNGLYFREFRTWFFKRMTLLHIHLFESRTATFQDILQESVITSSRRLGKPSTQVSVTHSIGKELSGPLYEFELPIEKAVDTSSADLLVRIPETPEDARILDCMDAWGHEFSALGLRISTGPVVMFRAKKFLRDTQNGRGASVPLLSAHNIKPFTTIWPVEKKKWPLAFADCPESQKHLVPTRNYVLLKRFTAKEERRRLIASCLLACNQKHRRLALENHINYVCHAARQLTQDEVFGIAALFNSVLLDRYFRCISGNTQVNATEIRIMPFPELDVVRRIGARAKKASKMSSSELEECVLHELSIDGRLKKYLEDRAG